MVGHFHFLQQRRWLGPRPWLDRVAIPSFQAVRVCFRGRKSQARHLGHRNRKRHEAGESFSWIPALE